MQVYRRKLKRKKKQKTTGPQNQNLHQIVFLHICLGNQIHLTVSEIGQSSTEDYHMIRTKLVDLSFPVLYTMPQLLGSEDEDVKVV